MTMWQSIQFFELCTTISWFMGNYGPTRLLLVSGRIVVQFATRIMRLIVDHKLMLLLTNPFVLVIIITRDCHGVFVRWSRLTHTHPVVSHHGEREWWTKGGSISSTPRRHSASIHPYQPVCPLRVTALPKHSTACEGEEGNRFNLQLLLEYVGGR